MLMKYYQLLCKIPTRTSLVENVVYPDIPVKYKSPIFQRGSIEIAPENGVLYFRYKGTIDSTNTEWYILPITENTFLLRSSISPDNRNQDCTIYKCLLLDKYIIITDVFYDVFTQKRKWEISIHFSLKNLPESFLLKNRNDIIETIQENIASNATLMDYAMEKLSLWDDYIKWQESILLAKTLKTRRRVKIEKITPNTVELSSKGKTWWKDLDTKSSYTLRDEYEYDEYDQQLELEFTDHVRGNKAKFKRKKERVYSYYDDFEKGEEYLFFQNDIGTEVMLKRLKANIKNLKECSDLHAIHTLLWLYDIEHESRMDSYSNDEIRFHNRYLNEEQKQAVKLILETKDVSFILGPPGTGKTSVIAEAVYQLTKNGKTVLVSSQSNDAIDNALEKLYDNPDMRIVRLTRDIDIDNPYHVDRILSNIVTNIENHLAAREEEGNKFVKKYLKASEAIPEAYSKMPKAITEAINITLTNNESIYKRYHDIVSSLEINHCNPDEISNLFTGKTNLSIKEIAYRINNSEHFSDLLKGYKSYLSNKLKNRLSPDDKKKVEQVSQKTEIIHNILTAYRKNKFDVNDDIKAFKSIPNQYLHDHVIKNTNVFGITCNANSDKLLQQMDESLRNMTFDYVLIDEVSKATLPEIIGCILKGDKVVLIGDHRQLPPVFNEDKKQKDLSPDELKQIYVFKELITNTIFKKLYDKAPDDIKCMLTKQYRMHNEIANMAISKFYVDCNNNTLLENGLSDQESDKMKSHTITIDSMTTGKCIISPDHHAYWIDSSVPARENERIYEEHQGTSSYNTYEIRIIKSLVQKIDACLSSSNSQDKPSVGIISFYASQNDKLRNTISTMKKNLKALDKIDVNTVDKFQGQERDIIIVSMVRSVEEKRIPLHNSFFKAYERINVAFSRARKLLIVVGSTKFCEKQSIAIPPLGGQPNDASRIINRHIYREIIDVIRKSGTVILPVELIGDRGDSDE